jgi:hypothetical protein
MSAFSTVPDTTDALSLRKYRRPRLEGDEEADDDALRAQKEKFESASQPLRGIGPKGAAKLAPMP